MSSSLYTFTVTKSIKLKSKRNDITYRLSYDNTHTRAHTHHFVMHMTFFIIAEKMLETTIRQ